MRACKLYKYTAIIPEKSSKDPSVPDLLGRKLETYFLHVTI